ncbi:MAG: purine-nucleoside phosphorylase [Treponemataceae bacterium]|nr:MAG: purine-nucleoside phosphorylase [Treponemataceae bacterium]
MSTHIAAKDGEIADSVLLPGDPLRAQFIADNFLENAVCYTKVRGMFGFTGIYKGKKVSVQSTGMGQASMSIYATELFEFYNVQKAIRVGTCGSISEKLKVRDVVLSQGSGSDSAMQTQRFGYLHYAPLSDFELLAKAAQIAKRENIPHAVGLVATSDFFYDKNDNWKKWAQYGALAMEMESAELYTLAAEYKRRALAVFTVSDNILTGGATTAEEREKTFTSMIRLALETLD